MIYDFHTHTCISDGALSPLELVRRALVNTYNTIAVTDHVGIGYLERLITEITADCSLAEENWNIRAIPGVELTHVPVKAIAQTAATAKKIGAKLVVVHGETNSEPVEPGTNLAAVSSTSVDILAHPGQLTLEEANLAAQNNVFLEITARISHSSTNKHVVQIARSAGAKILINDFWSEVLARMALSRSEREAWESDRRPPLVKAGWLLSRIAAKDATRILDELAVCLADVTIQSGPTGEPVVASGTRPGVQISLAHKAFYAVAAASRHHAGVGIDVEPVGNMDSGVVNDSFDHDERRIIESSSGSYASAWCAKEAVGKAIQLNLLQG